MKYIFGNWKMYLDFDESMLLINGLLQEEFNIEKINLAVFPSALAVREVAMSAKGSAWAVGAQNFYWLPKGAYTGEVSAQMFKDVGCEYALVGHSERRHVFGETDDDVRKKLEACLDVGLTPILCVGETKEDRKTGKTEYRIKKQIMKAFAELDLDDKQVIIAYEPVWAISKGGVGEPCTPEEAAKSHNLIATELKQYTDKSLPIIYGGSANAQNVLAYLSQEAIAGVLVGHASTKVENFVPLIHAVETI